MRYLPANSGRSCCCAAVPRAVLWLAVWLGLALSAAAVQAEEPGNLIQLSAMTFPAWGPAIYQLADPQPFVMRGSSVRFRLAISDRWALRFDAVNPSGSAQGGRALFEFRSPYLGGGVGLGVISLCPCTGQDKYSGYTAGKPDGLSLVLVAPAWLRVGPDAVHVGVRLAEGGPLADGNDKAAATVGSTLRLARWLSAGAEVGWSQTGFGHGPEATATVRLWDVGLAAQVRRIGVTLQGHGIWQAGLAVAIGGGFSQSGPLSMRHSGHLLPRDDTVVQGPSDVPLAAEETAATAWLEPGTVLQLRAGPLRVRTDGSIPPSEAITCTVDEAVERRDRPWRHVTCAGSLPDDAPPAWRTGCYYLDRGAVWRAAFCPGEVPPPYARAERVVRDWHAAIPQRERDFGLQALPPRVFQVGGRPIRAVCEAEVGSESAVERCYAPGIGLVWSARHWLTGPTPRAEYAVRIVATHGGGKIDPRAPHLRFARPDSALCEVQSACPTDGACQPTPYGCRPASSGDCRLADVCRDEGRCHLVGGECAALADSDCSDSAACLSDGRCRARAGRCVGNSAPTKEQP